MLFLECLRQTNQIVDVWIIRNILGNFTDITGLLSALGTPRATSVSLYYGISGESRIITIVLSEQ